MTSDKIEIRYATAGDNVRLADFGAQAFSDSFAADNTPENMAAYLAVAFSPEIQAAELAEPGSVFLIAEIDGAMVGFARLKEGQPLVDVEDTGPVELVRIYAGLTWIGKGVGAALMQACLDEARRREYDSIWLGVWEHNRRAPAFYRKWEFIEVSSQPFQLGDELQTDLVMSRRVEP
jgi:ribosomal protein S18 acetylase RimI-like enzyme